MSFFDACGILVSWSGRAFLKHIFFLLLQLGCIRNEILPIFIVMEMHKWNYQVYITELHILTWPKWVYLSCNVYSLDMLLGLWKALEIVGCEAEIEKQQAWKVLIEPFYWLLYSWISSFLGILSELNLFIWLLNKTRSVLKFIYYFHFNLVSNEHFKNYIF